MGDYTFYNKDLIRMYFNLNKRYFNNELPPLGEKVSIRWSNRLIASAGICKTFSTGRIEILISTHYHIKFPFDIEDTVTHEMIHIKHHGHGRDFKNEMYRIRALGGKVSLRAKEKSKYKWEYICECGTINYPTAKRFTKHTKYLCSYCNSPLTEWHLEGEIKA